MNNEPPLEHIPKLIMTFTVIILIGILFGMLGYYLGNKNVTKNTPVAVKYQKDQLNKINEKETENNKQEDAAFLEKIADWETYKNEEFGFEIKYPENVEKIYEKNTEIRFDLSLDSTNYKYLSILYTEPGISPRCINPLTVSEVIKREDIELNDIEFVKEIGSEGATGSIYNSISYSKKRNDKCFSLNLIVKSNASEEIDLDKESKLFNYILSTFKFTNTDKTADWMTYSNKKYGFEITLLESWKGYKVFEKLWNGTTLDGHSVKYEGPKIIIRNPKWSEYETWQDIPMLVFTKDEWRLIEANNLNIFTAPIAPKKLGENNRYVFALPPRWIGFTNTLGQNEAQKIVETLKIIASDKTKDLRTYKGSKIKIGSAFSFKYSPEIWSLEEIDLTHKDLNGCTLSPGVLWRNRLVNIISSEDIILNDYEARKVKIGAENSVSSINYYFDSETSAVFNLSVPENKKDKATCEEDIEIMLNTISF
ncbi:MAG: hypothetical protein U9P70_04095 [Patescibacteria group bacterium]|nr:hypothetical protein [Patescibacteria group bacterium]